MLNPVAVALCSDRAISVPLLSANRTVAVCVVVMVAAVRPNGAIRAAQVKAMGKMRMGCLQKFSLEE